MTLLWVLVGAAVGAPLRYVTDLVVQSRHGSVLPWGTVTVNTAGSCLLGVAAGALSSDPAAEWVLPLVGTGFCGGLTTFSTFAFETMRLLQDGARGAAVVNVAVSVAGAVGGCALGWLLGSSVG